MSTEELPAVVEQDEDIDGESSLRAVLGSALTFLLILLAWEGLVRYIQIRSWLLPAPSEIAYAMWEWRAELAVHTLTTLYETVIGFSVAIIISIPLAVLIVYSKLLQNTIYPILLVFQSVPKVAIAPLLVLWIGFGILPKVVIVFLVCFFPIVVATATGLSAIPTPLMELIRSLSASSLQTFVKIRFPTALPHIFVGLKIAVTFAVIGAVIGEFVGSESGLGYLILVSTSQSRTPVAFGALVILTVMSIALYYAIVLIERFAVPWAPKN